MKQYHNDGRETALALLRSKQYDALEEYLLEAVVFGRRHFDQFYEFCQNHGTPDAATRYKEEDASS